MTWLVLVDLLLVAGLTARLTRLVVADDLGRWWVQVPVFNWMATRQVSPRWARYADGLRCPFCVGFHLGWLVLLSLWLAGGPGHAAEWWRWVAGAFTLNYVVAHVGSRLGDTDD